MNWQLRLVLLDGTTNDLYYETRNDARTMATWYRTHCELNSHSVVSTHIVSVRSTND